MKTPSDETVRSRFLAPVHRALQSATSRRRCWEFPDKHYLESGVCRVVARVQSGRDWVQTLRMWMNSNLSVYNFFESLKSSRRLALLEEIAEHVRAQLDAAATCSGDPLREHKELDGFALYASDGHYEMASAHAERIEGDAQPAGYFFSISLRSHSLALLDIARPKRKREHDMSALKRLGATALRLGQPQGRKVIHVYDPAAIDYQQWFRWKSRGVYLVSREKANSTAEVVGVNTWDSEDPRNTGVLSDELIGVFCGVLWRRVRYRDPASGTQFSFVTNEMTLPPGLIAFLYKLRWDIEKVFDEKKNKLEEKKAWAGSPVARCQQAHFVCLAHNLLVLLERDLEQREGIRDTKVEEKRKQREVVTLALIEQCGRISNPLVQKCSRSTQRSLQFIRWLRHCLFYPTLWRHGVDVLRPLMEAYLS